MFHSLCQINKPEEPKANKIPIMMKGKQSYEGYDKGAEKKAIIIMKTGEDTPGERKYAVPSRRKYDDENDQEVEPSDDIVVSKPFNPAKRIEKEALAEKTFTYVEPVKTIFDKLIPERINVPSYFFTNKIFSRYLKSMKNLHSQYFKHIYNNSVKELIGNKISQLEHQINSMKEPKNLDQKVQNMRVNSKKAIDNTTQNNKLSPIYIDDIFLNSQSIKELESKLEDKKDLEKTSSFNFSLLAFYSTRNIDKAFNYFLSNISNNNIAGNIPVAFDHNNFQYFFSKCIEYDRQPYLKSIYNYLSKSKLNILSNDSTNTIMNLLDIYFLYHLQNGVKYEGKNYESSILAIKYFFLLDSKYTKDFLERNPNINISGLFDELADIKFKTRRISENDDMMKILQAYIETATAKTLNINFSDESLVKILTLFFDINYTAKNTHAVIDLIFSLSNAQKTNIASQIKLNLIAYYNLYGFLPASFNEEILRTKYMEYRSKTSTKSLPVLKDNELDLFITLFKFNNMKEFIADILSHWNSLTNENEVLSKLYLSNFFRFCIKF